MLKKFTSDSSINSFLGEHTNFKGIFTINGPLRIDGHFIGKVNSTGKVIIGKSGMADSTIVAKTVVVGGVVKGDIFAEDKVTVLKTGQVIGNIFSCSVSMEDGVVFNGNCKIITKKNIKELIDTKTKEEYYFN